MSDDNGFTPGNTGGDGTTGPDNDPGRERSEDELTRELSARAHAAPADTDVRAKLDTRIERRAKRKRTTSLIAVAAAVVLIAGGVTVTRSLLTNENGVHTASPGPGGSNGAPAVVQVPEVPLPDDTQLVRYQLKPVTSPVSATPPKGLSGPTWLSSDDTLVVVWANASAILGSGPAGGSADGSADVAKPPSHGMSEVGYSITDSKSLAVTPFQLGAATGAGDGKGPDVSTKPFEVGGHKATLVTPAEQAGGAGSEPLGESLMWQLSNGQWIHVWAEAASPRGTTAPHGTASLQGTSHDAAAAPSTALVDFAASITEHSTTLPRAIGIGLTLPGLTHVSSVNNLQAVSVLTGLTYLCPAAADPFEQEFGWSSSSGSGSASAPASRSASAPGSASAPAPSSSSAPGGVSTDEGESAAIQPGTEPGADSSTDSGIFTSGAGAQCITAAVTQAPRSEMSFSGKPVTVGTSTVRVNEKSHSAMADLGHQVHAFISAPASAHLSAQDLAALAASVRLSPAVTVLTQQQLQRLFGEGASDSGSASGSASAGASDSMGTTTEGQVPVPGSGGTGSGGSRGTSVVVPPAGASGGTSSYPPASSDAASSRPSSSAPSSSRPTKPGNGGPAEDEGFTIRLAPDHDVSGSVDAATRTGTVTVWLKNTASHQVTLTTVKLDVARLAQTSVHLDMGSLQASPNAPTIGSGIDADDPLPLQLAPGTEVPFTVAFDVEGCGALPAHRVPSLATEYRYSGGAGVGAGGGSQSLPDGLSQGAGVGDAWVKQLTQGICH